MQNIFKHEIFVTSYSENEELLKFRWTGECGNITRPEYKHEFEMVNRTLKMVSFRKAIFDFRECNYYIHPNEYSDESKSIFSRIRFPSGTFIVLIVPENLLFYARYEVNRTNLVNTGTIIQYFRDKEKAEKWLENK